MEGLIQLECIQIGGGAQLVDQGRPGMRHLGIPKGGPADDRAATRARQLLELSADAVLLELTLQGGQWLLSGKGQFVITGADMDWRINGRPVEMYTTIDFDGDYILDSSQAVSGCRSYLAINGKWEVEKTFGSVSPGLPQRVTIQAGWSASIIPGKEVDYTSDLDINQHLPPLPLSLEVLPGPEWNTLNSEQQAQIIQASYTVGATSNRQGIRLDASEQIVADYNPPSLISTPVLPGTVQLTPSGPILLFKDAQTIGGFPRILLAEPTSLDEVGQLKPGDEIRLTLG